MELYQAIKTWMEVYKKTSVKQATYDRMLISLKLMEKYSVSRIHVEELTGADVQCYINELLENGYALTTIKKQFNLISAYIRYANAEGIMSKPLYNTVKLPSQGIVRKPKREIVAYNEEEQARLKAVIATKSKSGYNLIGFMLATGLRVGEALALKQEDINWQRKAITVRRTLVRLATPSQSYVQDSPKSHASNRTIPLNNDAWGILASLPRTRTYVFGPDETHTFSYETLRTHAKAACKEAHIPYLGMHVFRHTFATNCYNKGCDVKLLSKLLGHGSVSVTYNTYIHLFGDALEEMRAVI